MILSDFLDISVVDQYGDSNQIRNFLTGYTLFLISTSPEINTKVNNCISDFEDVESIQFNKFILKPVDEDELKGWRPINRSLIDGDFFTLFSDSFLLLFDEKKFETSFLFSSKPNDILNTSIIKRGLYSHVLGYDELGEIILSHNPDRYIDPTELMKSVNADKSTFSNQTIILILNDPTTSCENEDILSFFNRLYQDSGSTSASVSVYFDKQISSVDAASLLKNLNINIDYNLNNARLDSQIETLRISNFNVPYNIIFLYEDGKYFQSHYIFNNCINIFSYLPNP